MHRMSAELYAELCDLFDQAIFMGRNGTFDKEPDTDTGRLRSTSPQARRFANAAAEAVAESLMERPAT
jgi:hypothetical protein